MSLNLSELIALVQDQVQKSVEFAEQMTVIGRDSDQSDIRIGLSEAEIELPVAFEIKETSVSAVEMKELIESGEPIDISNALLRLPNVDNAFEFALKDRMTLVRLAQDNDQIIPKIEPKKNSKQGANRTSLIDMLTEVHKERIKMLNWDGLKNQSFATLAVSIINTADRNSDSSLVQGGTIKFKFKMILK